MPCVPPWLSVRAPPLAPTDRAAVLTPLCEHHRRTGTDLAASLRAYLDSGGNLEAAASTLGVHPGHARDRLELWFALSAPDLLTAR